MGAVCCRVRLERVDPGPPLWQPTKTIQELPPELPTVMEPPVIQRAETLSFSETTDIVEARLKQSCVFPSNQLSSSDDSNHFVYVFEPQQSIRKIIKRGNVLRPKWQRGRAVREVYKLGRTLGTGGFAIVKMATNRKTMQQYACKIMSLPDVDAQVGENENSRLDVFREIEILSKMNHTNVLNLKEFYTEDHRVYLITELLTGGELLDAVVERGNYSEADACLCFKQLVEGIQYLHSMGVVHRDLKLENLLLDSPDDMTHIKIVDFGLAKMNGRRDRKMETVCGTPQYVAPEVIKSEALPSAYGKAVDMWGAGVVLFILLGGYPPFHHENESRMFDMIRSGRFNFDEAVWDTISPKAKDLIEKLLTVDPKARYTAHQCLQHPWFAGKPSSLHLSNTTENLKKNYRRQFRKAVNVVMTINKMKRLTISEDDSAMLPSQTVAA